MKIYWFYCFKDDKGKGRLFDHIAIVAKDSTEAWKILLGNSPHKESESVKKLKEEFRIDGVTNLNGETGEVAHIRRTCGHVSVVVQQHPAKDRFFNNHL